MSLSEKLIADLENEDEDFEGNEMFEVLIGLEKVDIGKITTQNDVKNNKQKNLKGDQKQNNNDQNDHNLTAKEPSTSSGISFPFKADRHPTEFDLSLAEIKLSHLKRLDKEAEKNDQVQHASSRTDKVRDDLDAVLKDNRRLGDKNDERIKDEDNYRFCFDDKLIQITKQYSRGSVERQQKQAAKRDAKLLSLFRAEESRLQAALEIEMELNKMLKEEFNVDE